MKQHKGLPGVVSIITGEDLSVSWWSHKKNHLIFRVLTELDRDPDVLVCKLIHAKDTLIHRQLFPAFLTLALQGGDRLTSAAAQELLARVQAAELPLPATGAAAKELVSKLLVHAADVHTESGRHALHLQSWTRWAGIAKTVPLASVSEARAALTKAARALGASKALPL